MRLVPLAALLVSASRAGAAGGHHAVDDVSILEAGQCQIETWVDREDGNARRLLQAGTACRVGAVELGLNLDGTRVQGADTTTAAGPQIKWAQTVAKGFSVGVVGSTAWQRRSARRLSSTLVVPVTWQSSDSTWLHLNIGRDFRPHDVDTSRAGGAFEWTALANWAFVAERFRESRTNFRRAGARWTASASLSVDLSRASAMHDSAVAWWTLGLSWSFDR